MAGFNFGTFHDTTEEQEQTLPVPINETLPNLDSSNLPSLSSEAQINSKTNVVGELVNTTISALNPALMTVHLIDKTLGVISDISNCWTRISIAKEETRRVRTQVEGRLQLEKENTRRFIEQQKEETERIRLQCNRDLAIKKKELQIIKAQLKAQDTKSKRESNENKKALAILNAIIRSVMDSKQMFINQITDANIDITREEREVLYNRINEVDIRLEAIVRELVKMKILDAGN